MYFEFRSPRLIAALAAATMLLLPASANRAFADTYKLTTIESTQRENFFGIDATGTFTVNRTATLAGPGHVCGTVVAPLNCYETFYAGNSTPVFTTVPPSLLWDNGTSCTPSLGAGFSLISGLCNGSHAILSALYTSPQGTQLRGTWGGPDPDVVADYLSNGLIAGGFINSSGDAVFIDGLNNTLVFADDLSSNGEANINNGEANINPIPEPSTLALLGTGGLALVGTLRRRSSGRRV